MRDETAIGRLLEGDLGDDGEARILDYGDELPESAPESFVETRTDDDRKLKLVYDSEAGVWLQVGSDSLTGADRIVEEE